MPNRSDQGEHIDPKQIPRIQSKLDAIMRPIAQYCIEIITEIDGGMCIKKFWVSGVWMKVELQQQGCSCTRIH